MPDTLHKILLNELEEVKVERDILMKALFNSTNRLRLVESRFHEIVEILNSSQKVLKIGSTKIDEAEWVEKREVFLIRNKNLISTLSKK